MKSLLLLATIFIFSMALHAQNLYFPPITGNDWDTISPTSLGWCEPEIDSLLDFLAQEESKAFIILKDGKIVLEEYFDGFHQDSSWVWFSAGKSLMTTLIGIAQTEGYLDIDDKTSDYLGQGWTSLPTAKEDLIKIKHQLTMTTGLDEGDDIFCTDDTCLQYLADAGSRWYYHNAPYSLLKPVLESATGMDINTYTILKIRAKTGMNGFWLPAGYNNFFFSTPRSMARFGLLTLNKGTWNGNPVLSDTTYYHQMVNTSQNLNPSYGYLWWLNGKGSFIPPSSALTFNSDLSPDAPSDAFLAAGAQGQLCIIVPSQNMVIVRMGSSNNQNLVSMDLHNEIWKRLNAVMCSTTTTLESVQPNLKIFPNPATQQIQVNLDTSVDFSIKIYNSMGQLVRDDIFQNTIDISDLANGMYFLQIQQHRTTTTLKFLKS